MKVLWAWLALLLPASLAAQHSSGGPYFYRPLDYGSASTTTPASLFLNRGFSIIQMSDAYPRDPRDLNWGMGADRVLSRASSGGRGARRGMG
jgi:hypothetical protein